MKPFTITQHTIIEDKTRPYGGRHGGMVLRKLTLKYNSEQWEGAACAGLDTNLFFPDMHDVASLPLYRKMCADCPVFDTCLEWSVVHERYGIWAGTSENEREKIRRHAGIACNELHYEGLLWS